MDCSKKPVLYTFVYLSFNQEAILFIIYPVINSECTHVAGFHGYMFHESHSPQLCNLCTVKMYSHSSYTVDYTPNNQIYHFNQFFFSQTIES